MGGSLRTRLFVTVGLVVAAAIAASGLLSRRATLVELREVVSRAQPLTVPLESIRAHVEREVNHGVNLDVALANAAREAGRPLVVIGPRQEILGASRPELAGARVRRATPDGELALELTGTGDARVLSIAGAPPLPVADAQGHATGWLYVLPPEQSRQAIGRLHLVPPWLLATASVALIALVLTFALSRRILRPVGELREAAERLQRGELDVQVAVRGDDEIAELGRTFNRMAAQLAGTERLRRQMVSDVAHELRSPVTNLRCMLEAVQDGLAPADRAGIDALHEETLFLQRLIADLEDLALADAGRLQLRRDEVNVGEVVRRAAGSMAKAPGAAIAVRVEPDLPCIRGDADRLEQVVRNLLSNARRHTPADGTIRVSAAPAERSLRIAVQDTGSGIAREHLSRVFDRFYRADPSRARATGGAGLGLAIVRELVTAHGGTIRVDSAGEGQGATFTIDLPAAGAGDPPEQPLAARPSSKV